MALTAQQLLDGINAASFNEEEWANAMLYLKLTVELGILRGQVVNVNAWESGKVDEATVARNALNEQIAAVEAQINALAPSP